MPFETHRAIEDWTEEGVLCWAEEIGSTEEGGLDRLKSRGYVGHERVVWREECVLDRVGWAGRGRPGQKRG